MADDALIHARWHRALDDLSSEPDGPIRDHIEAHDAQVRRDLAAKVEALVKEATERAYFKESEASVRVPALRALLADALPQDAAAEPVAGSVAAGDACGASVDVPGAAGRSDAQRGVCSTCGQPFNSPPCCTSPFGMSGHTVEGPGPMENR